MLSRFEGREIRVTAEDGTVFTGTAEAFPSGYGLHEFGREEECVRLDDVVLFLSDIRRIEDLTKHVPGSGDPRRLLGLLPAHARAFPL